MADRPRPHGSSDRSRTSLPHRVEHGHDGGRRDRDRIRCFQKSGECMSQAPTLVRIDDEIDPSLVGEAPNFLIEWEPRWLAFATALVPALRKSPRQLQGECKPGLFPASGMVTAWLMELALLVAAITLPTTLEHIRPPLAPTHPKYDVIYFSGDELPKTT